MFGLTMSDFDSDDPAVRLRLTSQIVNMLLDEIHTFVSDGLIDEATHDTMLSELSAFRAHLDHVQSQGS